MTEYEIRVAGAIGRFAESACPGFCTRQSVRLVGFADGPADLLRILTILIDRQPQLFEMNVLGYATAAGPESDEHHG